MRVRLLSVDVTQKEMIMDVKNKDTSFYQINIDLYFKFSISHKSNRIKYLTFDIRKRRNQIKCDKILKNIDVILNSNETRF